VRRRSSVVERPGPVGTGSHARRRGRGGLAMWTPAARRVRRPRRPTMRMALDTAVPVLARGVGVLAGCPPDDPEQHEDRDLQDEHQPDESPGHVRTTLGRDRTHNRARRHGRMARGTLARADSCLAMATIGRGRRAFATTAWSSIDRGARSGSLRWCGDRRHAVYPWGQWREAGELDLASATRGGACRCRSRNDERGPGSRLSYRRAARSELKAAAETALRPGPLNEDEAAAFLRSRLGDTAETPLRARPAGGERAGDRRLRDPLEATIAVAVLLQRFELKSKQEGVPLDTQGITLRPKGAVPIHPAPR
jgi:hypothetical protein